MFAQLLGSWAKVRCAQQAAMHDFDHFPSPWASAGSPMLTRPLVEALAILAQAHRYAEDVGSDVWDFAVEVSELCKTGASLSDLRWLLYRGFAGHQVEVAAPAQSRRLFTPTACGAFTPNSCFVITELGRFVVAENSTELTALFFAHGPSPLSILLAAADSPGNRRTRRDGPHFDEARCELCFNGRLVKRFRRSAPSQKTILASFEEASWPVRIDDPLSPQEGLYAKRRLSDAIKGLNRRHVEPAIHFFGDGTGEGIVWEPVG